MYTRVIGSEREKFEIAHVIKLEQAFVSAKLALFQMQQAFLARELEELTGVPTEEREDLERLQRSRI
jgi:hypothetical protein